MGLKDLCCGLEDRIEDLENANSPDLDEQTLSTTVVDGVTTQVTISNGNTIDILHPEHECVHEVTRGQLLALRNGGNLDMSCHYLMANAGNGCLGDVVIRFDPVDVDKLGTDVAIHTTHDAEAWKGRYDISENQIEALQDNRGNKVYGDTQAEVNAFPWGNAQWINVTVDRARVQVECDTALQVRDTEFKTASSTDLRGATGFIRSSSFGEATIVQWNAAAISVTSLSMDSRARIYGNGSSDVIITELSMQSEAFWQFAGRSDVRSIYVNMDSSSRVYFTAGDRQWLYYTSINSYGHVRQDSGTIQMYYSTIESYGEFRNEANSGIALIYGIHYSSRAYVRNRFPGTWRAYYDSVDSRGEIIVDGTGATKTTYYNHVHSYGWLHLLAASTIAYAVDVGSGARFVMNGGNHYRNRLGSFSRVTTAFNTRNIYSDGSFAQTLSAANNNTHRGFGVNTLV